MPKYLFRIVETVTYEAEISAKDEDLAEEKAFKLFDEARYEFEETDREIEAECEEL